MWWKTVGVNWKEREGDGSEELSKGEESFLYERFMYIYRTLLVAQI